MLHIFGLTGVPRRYVPLTHAVVALLAFATCLFPAHDAYAQCRPTKHSHEARLLAFYAMPIVFNADPDALALPAHGIRLSAEGAYVPTPSADIQHTDYCYTGHVEHTSLARAFGRPRLTIGLPHGIGAEFSDLPPIRIGDATPNLRSAALWLTRPLGTRTTFSIRAHMTRGSVHGPITCPKSALQQSAATDPCYGTEPSNDMFLPSMFGGELIASASPWAMLPHLHLNASLGVNALDPEFRVNFSDLLGGTDHTTIRVKLTRVTSTLGATWQATTRCSAAAQGFASFGDGTTVRALIGCALLR